MEIACPLCGIDLLEEPQDVFETSGQKLHCPNCGEFELDERAKVNLPLLQGSDPNQRAILSYSIRMMYDRAGSPKLSWDLIERITQTTDLPSPPEQIDRLLLLLGDSSHFLGEVLSLECRMLIAQVGAANAKNLVQVLVELMNLGYFEGDLTFGERANGKLSLSGWLKHEQLKKGRSTSRKAFMAMQFDDPSLDKAFSECFKPAVLAAGFRLRRLDDEPSAGLIDDRLRIEIRTSRFLIADLTRGNQGAYWEAGYAEGLGLPVIYTCEEGFFDEQKTHFDANHHLTVKWNKIDFAEASRSLKATIRATLPGEATLEDPTE